MMTIVYPARLSLPRSKKVVEPPLTDALIGWKKIEVLERHRPEQRR
jgi:hypothetical protein